ncbi:MAG: TorF family putative porin [Sphingobium sp.]|nr:TorF family putative porin [Sphingobium sp.]
MAPSIVDVGVLYYYYPGSGGAANTDFVEPYASDQGNAFGPVTAKAFRRLCAQVGSALTVGNGKEDTLYVAGDLGAAVGDTGL